MWHKSLVILWIAVQLTESHSNKTGFQRNDSLSDHRWKEIEGEDDGGFGSFFIIFTAVFVSLSSIGLLIFGCCLIKDTRMADSFFSIFRNCGRCCRKESTKMEHSRKFQLPRRISIASSTKSEPTIRSEPRSSHRIASVIGYSSADPSSRNDFLNSVKTNCSSYHSLDQDNAPPESGLAEPNAKQMELAGNSVQSASDSFKSLENL